MFRSLGKSKIAFVLAILFGISLFFFRSGSRYSNFFNSDSVVATVSGTPVSTSKFNRTMQMNITKFNQMLGKSMNGDEIRKFQIHSMALGSLINDAVFEDEYDQINFKVDEKVIAQNTKDRIPQLYDANNKLNQLYLTTFLQQQQLTIEDIVQIINFDTRDEYMNNAFFNINYPHYFSNKINNFNKHERNVSYVKLSLDQVNINEIIKEYSNNLKKELVSFYDDNVNQYMSKEKRNVEYSIIDKTSLSSKFSPTDLEIKEYYNTNKELFFKNEKRSFIQFNFKTIQEAENFKLQIQNLDTLKILEYAKENNLRFNEFRNLEATEIMDEIAEPLFNLYPEEQSNVITTSIAKHIIILQSIQPPIQLKLEAVIKDIEATITKIETDNYYQELTSKISEKVLNGESISSISNKFNLTKESIENLTKDYSNYDESKEIFFTSLIPASFSANKDFVSDIIKINENISYVFNVTDIVLPSPLKFETIEDTVLNDWKTIKRVEKIKLEVEQNRNNKSFLSQLSNQYDLNINEISLTNNSNELPRNFITNIFQYDLDTNIEIINDDKFYIAKINDINMSNENKTSEIISIASDLRSSFGEELKRSKKISINDNLVNAIIDQY